MQSVANSGFRYGVRTLHLIKLHGSQQLYDLHDMSRLFSTQEHICMCLVMYRLFVLFPKRDLTKNKENLNEDKTAKTFIDQQKEEFHEHEELRTEVMK